MQLGEFIKLFEGWDPELEVQVRVVVPEGNEEVTVDEFEGEYCDVTDDRSVLIENGKATIIADWPGQ